MIISLLRLQLNLIRFQPTERMCHLKCLGLVFRNRMGLICLRGIFLYVTGYCSCIHMEDWRHKRRFAVRCLNRLIFTHVLFLSQIYSCCVIVEWLHVRFGYWGKHSTANNALINILLNYGHEKLLTSSCSCFCYLSASKWSLLGTAISFHQSRDGELPIHFTSHRVSLSTCPI